MDSGPAQPIKFAGDWPRPCPVYRISILPARLIIMKKNDPAHDILHFSGPTHGICSEMHAIRALYGAARHLCGPVRGFKARPMCCPVPGTKMQLKMCTQTFVCFLLIIRQFRETFSSRNENISRITEKNTRSVWAYLPKSRTRGAFWALVLEFNFRFKTRMNRAHDVMYQCFSMGNGLM